MEEPMMTNGGIAVVKARFGDDLRRFLISDLATAPGAAVPTYSALESKLKVLFSVKSKKLRISYLDKDGDTVTMACDADLRDALVEQQLDPLRITLQPPRYNQSSKSDMGFDVGQQRSQMDLAMPPIYKISRAVKQVTEVWEEYTKGLNGGPAVMELERDPSWKKQEKQYLSRRRAIYECIRTIARKENCSPEIAAKMLEQRRTDAQQTLAQLQQELCDKRALEFGRKRKRLDDDMKIPALPIVDDNLPDEE